MVYNIFSKSIYWFIVHNLLPSFGVAFFIHKDYQMQKENRGKCTRVSEYYCKYICNECKNSFELENDANKCFDNHLIEINRKEKFCPLNCKHYDIPKDFENCKTCKKFEFCYPHINEPKEMLCTSCWNYKNNLKCKFKKFNGQDLYVKI